MPWDLSSDWLANHIVDTFDHNPNFLGTVAHPYGANHVLTHLSKADTHSAVARTKREKHIAREMEREKFPRGPLKVTKAAIVGEEGGKIIENPKRK